MVCVCGGGVHIIGDRGERERVKWPGKEMNHQAGRNVLKRDRDSIDEGEAAAS